MIIKIDRFYEKQSKQIEYKIDKKVNTVLDSLIYIKTKKDNSLTFKAGCKSGVCGTCGVVVNGVEKLACKTKVNNGDIISPLKNSKVIKDLVVDLDYEKNKLEKSLAFLDTKSDKIITKEDEKLIDIQSNCILCQLCYSSCPIFEVNQNFLGPFALTRVLRYVNDKKEDNIKSKIDIIQKDGIWDCTLCGNCTMVCPQHIDSKTDIINLRNKSAMMGYSDPNLAIMSFGGGFNPNGF